MSSRKRSLQTIDFILLGLLSRQPMHGYELYKELTRLEGVGMVWRIKQSLLYAILDNLKKEALLTQQWVQGESRPDRKEYHLTLSGKTCFLEWISQPVQHGRDMRQDFLARLYFARETKLSTAHRLLVDQINTCQKWLTGFEDSSGKLEAEQIFEKLVVQFRIQQTEAMLKWLEHCKSQLTTGEPS